MHATSTDLLIRTRTAFKTWRSSHAGRRRIPDHLWNAALALLSHYSLTRICRELRLSPKQLRQRQLSAATPLVHKAASGLQFVEMRVTDLGSGPSTFKAVANSPRHPAELGMRLIFERIDGSRLTLCLAAADWSQLTMLCANFMRER